MYEYSYSHTWRNFGIVVGFVRSLVVERRSFAQLVFFYALLLIGVERQKDLGAAGGVMLFKKGRAPAEVEDAALGKKVASDEETGDAQAVTTDEKKQQDKEQEKAAGALEPNRDVFVRRSSRRRH